MYGVIYILKCIRQDVEQRSVLPAGDDWAGSGLNVKIRVVAGGEWRIGDICIQHPILLWFVHIKLELLPDRSLAVRK